MHEYTEGEIWDRDGVRIQVAPTDHRPVAPDHRIPDRTRGCVGGVGRRHGALPSLDALAAGAGALVHTVIRKDLIEAIPQQRIRDICDYHSSVEEAAATATRAGGAPLILTHYVPPIAPGQEDAWRALGGLGVRPADRSRRRPSSRRGSPGRVRQAGELICRAGLNQQ